jgi:RNA polymerase sigma-70 factor (ECF subfamily)
MLDPGPFLLYTPINGSYGRSGGEFVGSDFPTTEWSLVVAAGDTSAPNVQKALETLCSRYWYPVYACARQLGNDVESARDLTQGFFAHLLEKHALESANSDRGRFRSFLRSSFRNFAANESRAMASTKRGGGRAILSLDFESAEAQYRLEPADNQTPEHSFERRWARQLLTRALERLGTEMEAIRVAVHRMRKRYGRILREEVARTVGHGEEVDDELGHLFAVVEG